MRDKDKYNEYQSEYQRQRYHKRRLEAIQYLGGKCNNCSSLENLELDHIDRNKKSFGISKLWSISKEKYQEELEKCQVLCRNCHEKKTLKDLGRVSAKDTHGTVSSSRYCKCDLCRNARNAYSKEYKRLWRLRRKALTS
jgi:5-methylcytosine-specific restriction endonuclease McrA